MAHSPVILLGLQLLNAIFIGILGGIGMLYFQDLMPGQAGSATTLYTNTSRVGWIIGRISGGHRRRDSELSRCVLVCDGDDYRHSVLLTAD